jgi:hypothetical protein
MLPQLVDLRRKRVRDRETVEEEKVERTDEEVLTDLCMVLRNVAAHAPKLVLESDLMRPIVAFLEQMYLTCPNWSSHFSPTLAAQRWSRAAHASPNRTATCSSFLPKCSPSCPT